MSTVTTQLKTTGMHCGSCAMLIDMTVGDVAGVQTVKTDYATGTTTVTYDSGVVALDGIVHAIQSAGYDAEPAA